MKSWVIQARLLFDSMDAQGSWDTRRPIFMSILNLVVDNNNDKPVRNLKETVERKLDEWAQNHPNESGLAKYYYRLLNRPQRTVIVPDSQIIKHSYL